jgi:8-oxo-dGTP pyrophosphatase MutT (NUDIX family)
MNKRKVQTVIIVDAEGSQPQALLFKTNAKRGSFWQNVTGSVEAEDESDAQAALREAREESGLDPQNIDLIIPLECTFFFKDQYGKNVSENVFLIKCKKIWDVTIDPKEHQAYKWMPTQDIQREVVKYESNFIALTKAIEKL